MKKALLKQRLLSIPIKQRPRVRVWEKSVFQKYAAKLAWNAAPTVSRLYDVTDILIEAHYKFFILQKKYPFVNDKHFMALFRTTLVRILVDMRKNIVSLDRESTKVDILFARGPDDSTSLADIIGPEQDLFYTGDEIPDDPKLRLVHFQNSDPKQIRRLIRDAPIEIKNAVGLIISSPPDVLDDIISTWSSRGRKKALDSHMLAALLGMSQRRAKSLAEDIIDWMEYARNNEN